MMGFTAGFAGGELVARKNEIESASWFDRDYLPRIPEKLSISRALIDWWREKGRTWSARDILMGQFSRPPGHERKKSAFGSCFSCFKGTGMSRSNQKCFKRV
jgi:hypothetical protein